MSWNTAESFEISHVTKDVAKYAAGSRNCLGTDFEILHGFALECLLGYGRGSHDGSATSSGTGLRIVQRTFHTSHRV